MIFPYFFPTTVCFLDDDMIYLNCIKPCLNENLGIFKLFSHPIDLLNFFHVSNKNDLINFEVEISEEEICSSDVNLNWNLNFMKKEIFQPDRFNRISIIIVDQKMPYISGEAFCRSFPSSKVKKLMLTGEEGYEKAVNLINSGMIDQFINKKEDDFFFKLNQAIENLQKKYFEENLSFVIQTLKKIHQPYFLLENSNFLQFFENFRTQRQIVEYYLIDLKNTFLCIDHKGNTILLIIQQSNDIEAYDYIVQCSNSNDKPSEEMMEKLKNKELIIYPPDQNSFNAKPKDWQNQGFLHKAQKINFYEEVTHYYALVENPLRL